MLDQVLRPHGITIDDVDLRTMPFPDMVLGLESGAIVAGILSEPAPTLAEDRGVGVRPIGRPANAVPVPITMVFVNTDWAAANPDSANRFMVSYLLAARDLALNDGWKDEANLAIMGQYTGVDLDVIRRARPHHIDPNLAVDQLVLGAQQEFNRDRGYLDYSGLLTDDQVFDWSYLEAALAQLGRL
jgi:ABC-type nitrate/sulfonate/bicarbonate transport system substrate-binding protein